MDSMYNDGSGAGEGTEEEGARMVRRRDREDGRREWGGRMFGGGVTCHQDRSHTFRFGDPT